MRAEDHDELWRVTAEQAENLRRSECDDLRLQVLALQREHQRLQDEHAALQATCNERLDTLRWVVTLNEAGSATLDHVIGRVRNTLGEVN